MGNISEYKPGSDITDPWLAETGLLWDPFDSCAAHTQRGVVCPKCGVLVVTRQSAHKLDLVARLSAFWVHSVPDARKDRFGTKRLHLQL